MPALKWTEEAIRQEALKYQTRETFRVGSKGAYERSALLGLRDEVCAHMTSPRTNWTADMLAAAAAPYNSRKDFERGNEPACQAARARGIMEDVCAHMGRKVGGSFTLEELKTEGAKYTGRKAFQLGNRAAFDAARKLGVLDKVCATRRFTHGVRKWFRENSEPLAAQCQSRAEFDAKHRGASAAARTGGYIDEICAHMDKVVTDNDAVYIWRAIGEYFNGKQVYKLGITSHRLGTYRIRDCATQWGVEPEIVAIARVEDARSVEAVLHILGDDPQYITGDGRTEFRALSDSELTEAIQYIEEVAA